MSAKKKAQQLDAASIKMVDVKIVEGRVESDEAFDERAVSAFGSDCSLRFFTGSTGDTMRGELKIWVETESSPPQPEAHGHFHFNFYYAVQNLRAWLPEDANGELSIDPSLQNAIAAVSYSTARGILIGRFQGTVFQRFILPVINPNDLLDTPSKSARRPPKR